MSETARSSRANRVAASPRARRAMRERGIDPSSVQGSGLGGRIVEADVLTHEAAPEPRVVAAIPQVGHVESVPISSMRRAVARVTSLSAATVPHTYLRAELDATALIQFRDRLQEIAEKRFGVRLSFTDFIVRAVALALKAHPFANRIWGDESMSQYATADVGLVVAVRDGLLIPVIRQADKLSLGELAQVRRDLVEKCESGKLPIESTHGAAAALTNLGRSRVDDFDAVISPPRSSMLAVGNLRERPYVVDGQLSVRPTLRLSLAVDHRVMDGQPASQFLDTIVEGLEVPEATFL